MVALTVVRNIPEFLIATNIDFTIKYSIESTPFGLVLLASVDRYICLLKFMKSEPDDKGLTTICKHFPGGKYQNVHQHCAINFDNLDEGNLNLLAEGSSFQEKVWRALLKIPRGSTCYYSEIANEIGSPTAVRACASAVGKNPIGYLVPCHRVIGRNGNCLKFAGGPEIKRCLLQYEGVIV